MKRPSRSTTARSHCCATRGLERAAETTPMTAAPATHVGDPAAAASTMPIAAITMKTRTRHDVEDHDDAPLVIAWSSRRRSAAVNPRAEASARARVTIARSSASRAA